MKSRVKLDGLSMLSRKLVLETEDLIIPHVEMQLRDFVLKPMCEIAPYKRHPLLGKTMTQLLCELEEKG